MKPNIILSFRPIGSRLEYEKNNSTKVSKKIFLLLFFICIFGCDNNDDKPNTPKTELEKLPPATQTGANTAGCLLNGVAFLPKGYFPGGALFFFYQDGKNFGLAIGERTIEGSSDIIRNIGIASLNQNLHDNVGVVFPLAVREDNSKYGTYSINSEAPPSPNFYSTNTIVTGELLITYHNFNNAILSGTFWFDAINSNGEKVEVREGRFDLRY